MKISTLWWKLIVAAMLVFLLTHDWHLEDTAEKIVRLQREERQAEDRKHKWQEVTAMFGERLAISESNENWAELEHFSDMAETHLSIAPADCDTGPLRIYLDTARKALNRHYAERRLAGARSAVNNAQAEAVRLLLTEIRAGEAKAKKSTP